MPGHYVHITGTWLDHFLQFDSVWYALIGKYGYAIHHHADSVFRILDFPLPVPFQAVSAFFPLLPFLSHMLSPIGSLILTNALFVCEVFLLDSWLRHNHLKSFWALLLFCVNPAGVFESALYPEPYLVFFGLLVLLFSETKNRYWLLSLVSGFGMSMVTGLGILSGILSLNFFARKEWGKGILYSISVLLGWFVFAGVMVRYKKPPLLFLHAQRVWDRTWTFPFVPWVKQLFDHSALGGAIFFYLAIYIAGFLVVVFQMRKNFAFGTYVWIVVYTLFTLSTQAPRIPVFSELRYISAVFPLYSIQWFYSKPGKWLAWLISALFVAAFVLGADAFSHGLPYE